MATPAETSPRFSVVVPVYNEGRNIETWCRAAAQAFPPGGEFLVVYDFEEDDTLEALRRMPDESRLPGLRLLHNALGRGVRGAIESGFRAARGEVVFVSMADLSDDVARAPEMLERAENGAAVVCASRYSPGGTQHGGPRLKGLLSRVAGRSLHLLCGVPTSDPTNSFKAYRGDFLGCTPIESAEGFCLALELTLKAHFSGRRVEEVPAQWWDRSSGQSRFRLWRWLPHYLHWYVWAFQQRLLGRGRRRRGGDPGKPVHRAGGATK